MSTHTPGPTSAAEPPPEPAPRRWWRYVFHKQLICPRLHHFQNSVKVNESGFIQCKHWIAAEHRECGLWIFVLAIRGGKAIVAEATEADMRLMDEQNLLTPAQMLDYLGVFDAQPCSCSPTYSAARPPAHGHHRR